jgi:hypothetical protein
MLSRDLFDLGTDPARFISYPGGRCYYIDEEVEKALRSCGVEPHLNELDELFWPFVDRAIKGAVKHFQQRGKRVQRTRLTRDELEQIRTKVHIFDKRRMYYLWYGNIDQSRIGRVPGKLYRRLMNKSRDQLEQFFMDLERGLDTTEYRQYVYVIFDLQRHFTEMAARVIPQILDQGRMDEFFLKEIGKLNSDPSFWAGMESDEWLHGYLTRYLIMFFDYDFGPSRFMDDYIRQFMDRHRQFRFPEKKSVVSMDEAGKIFGVGKDELLAMDKRRLTHLYRTKAHEYHPDKGGEQDKFIKLTQVYNDLLQRKK